MGCPLVIKQHKPKQKKMRFLVSFAFLLAVASLVLSARLKRETCDAGTKKDCIEAFDEYKYIKTTICKDECANCDLCEEPFTGLCKYCIESPDENGLKTCVERCEEGRKKCCACDEAADVKNCLGE